MKPIGVFAFVGFAVLVPLLLHFRRRLAENVAIESVDAELLSKFDGLDSSAKRSNGKDSRPW